MSDSVDPPGGGASSTGSETSAERSEELFARWLDRIESGDPLEFESLVGQHPADAEELRVLHAMWSRFESIASELTGVPSTDDARPPDHPRYRVERRLAGGGMGVIYEVLDAQLGRRLAMKVLRVSADQGTAKRRRSRFVDEARVVGQLEHPGIVPIHELGEDAGGNAWFTMRLVQGRTLSEILESVAAGEAKWTLARALGVLRRVCDTMAYAHSRDVIHRDLKPANVMVGPFGETYVMDWGLARIGPDSVGRDAEAGAPTGAPGPDDPGLPGRTLDGDVLGTPAYMSPEQARGDLATVGVATDVYAVGAMLHHLCGGRAPFDEANSAAEQLIALRAGAPRRLDPGSAPAELIAIAERAMRRDVAGRYAGMHELSADLDAYLEGRVVWAYEGGAWPELKKWVTRNRTLSASLGAAAVLSAVAVFALLRTAVVRNAEQAVTQRFRDLELLDDLRQDARVTLWPALPEQSATMRAWLARAAEIEGRLEDHRAAAAEPKLDAWTADKYAKLVAEIEAFVDGSASEGDRADVEQRLDRAGSLEQLARSEAAGRAWAAAAEYAPGVPRAVDLFPLGLDPGSGRPVFEHVLSASVERLDALAAGEDPGWVGRPASGEGMQLIALELQPGGADPVLVSRFELTREQWSRVSAGSSAEGGQLPRADLSWLEAAEGAWRLGLCLPSVLELTAGLLAGGTDTYWWGETLAEAEGAELLNWAGEAIVQLQPVGQGRANPFGLHDTYGGLTEWVRDRWVTDLPEHYEPSAPERSGPLQLEELARRTPRRATFGGHYLFMPSDLEAFFERRVPLFLADASERAPYRGLRPVRPAVLPED